MNPKDNEINGISVCCVGKFLGFAMIAFGIETSQHGLFVFCVSDLGMRAKLPSTVCQCMLVLVHADFHCTESHMTSHPVLALYTGNLKIATFLGYVFGMGCVTSNNQFK